MNRGNLNIQVCIYPFFDGGVYAVFSKAERLMRFSIGFIDFRLWWDGGFRGVVNVVNPDGTPFVPFQEGTEK